MIGNARQNSSSVCPCGSALEHRGHSNGGLNAIENRLFLVRLVVFMSMQRNRCCRHAVRLPGHDMLGSRRHSGSEKLDTIGTPVDHSLCCTMRNQHFGGCGPDVAYEASCAIPDGYVVIVAPVRPWRAVGVVERHIRVVRHREVFHMVARTGLLIRRTGAEQEWQQGEDGLIIETRCRFRSLNK